MKFTEQEYEMLFRMTAEERFDFYEKKSREIEEELGEEAAREMTIKELSEFLGESTESIERQAEENPAGLFIKLKKKARIEKRKWEESLGAEYPEAHSERAEILNKYPCHDRIYLKDEDIAKIITFYSRNTTKDETYRINPAMTKGVVVLESDVTPVHTVIFSFEYISSTTLKMKSYVEVMSDYYASCLIEDGEIKDFKHNYPDKEEKTNEMFRGILDTNYDILKHLFFFLENCENEVIVEKQSVVKTKKGKGKKKRITRKVYRIKTEQQEVINREEQKSQFHIESLTRGQKHWPMRLGSGKSLLR